MAVARELDDRVVIALVQLGLAATAVRQRRHDGVELHDRDGVLLVRR
jgi:hypothetical protein